MSKYLVVLKTGKAYVFDNSKDANSFFDRSKEMEPKPQIFYIAQACVIRGE